MTADRCTHTTTPTTHTYHPCMCNRTQPQPKAIKSNYKATIKQTKATIKQTELLYTMPKANLKITLSKKKSMTKATVVQPTSNCSICMEALKKPKIRVKLDSCEHTFCRACILKWAKRENSCPLCRVRFNEIKYEEKGKEKTTAVKQTSQGATLRRERRRSDGHYQQILDRFLERWGVLGEMHSRALTDLMGTETLFLSEEYAQLCRSINNVLQFTQVYIYFLQRRNINMWDIPENVLYRESCRTLVFIMFASSTTFRRDLELALQFPTRYTSRNRHVKAQMMFNIINRFMTLQNIQTNRRRPDLDCFRRCHRIVFPKTGEVVDVDEGTSGRVQHMALDDDATRVFNAVVIQFVNKRYHQHSDDHIMQLLEKASGIQEKLRQGDTDIWSDTVRPEEFPIL